MNDIPFVKDADASYGALTPVLLGVRRITANNPGPFTFTGSGVYVVGRGAVAVIDPGPDLPEHFAALTGALAGERITHILITHTHSDHCGMARRLADTTGAPIYGFGPHPVRRREDDAPALDEGADYSYAPDETLCDGDIVEGNGWRLEAVHTPGHLSNHLCFALPAQKALFTGDHIMGWATSVVAPPDGDMSDYIASLEKLLTRDDEIYLPTHGAPVANPHRFVRAIKTHRLMRDAQILDHLKKGRTDIKSIVPAMYADIDKRLHKAAALNVYAHLIRLVRTGAATCDGSPRLDSAYRATA